MPCMPWCIQLKSISLHLTYWVCNTFRHVKNKSSLYYRHHVTRFFKKSEHNYVQNYT